MAKKPSDNRSMDTISQKARCGNVCAYGMRGKRSGLVLVNRLGLRVPDDVAISCDGQ